MIWKTCKILYYNAIHVVLAPLSENAHVVYYFYGSNQLCEDTILYENHFSETHEPFFYQAITPTNSCPINN